jgi:hypothetical protein
LLSIGLYLTYGYTILAVSIAFIPVIVYAIFSCIKRCDYNPDTELLGTENNYDCWVFKPLSNLSLVKLSNMDCILLLINNLKKFDDKCIIDLVFVLLDKGIIINVFKEHNKKNICKEEEKCIEKCGYDHYYCLDCIIENYKSNGTIKC